MVYRNSEVEEMIDKACRFVDRNRCEKAFKDWTERQVKDTFRAAIYKKSFLICNDVAGEIIGVVHGIACHKLKLFYVSNILCIPHSGAIQALVRYFGILWPDYKLAGDRYGKFKQYDTLKFKRKVLKNV